MTSTRPAFAKWTKDQPDESVRDQFDRIEEHPVEYVSGEHVVLIRAHWAAGWQAPPHYHEHVEELMLVTEGAVTLTVGDETQTVSAGDTVIIPRGVIHDGRSESGAVTYTSFAPAKGQLPRDDFHVVEAATANGG